MQNFIDAFMSFCWNQLFHVFEVADASSPSYSHIHARAPARGMVCATKYVRSAFVLWFRFNVSHFILVMFGMMFVFPHNTEIQKYRINAIHQPAAVIVSSHLVWVFVSKWRHSFGALSLGVSLLLRIFRFRTLVFSPFVLDFAWERHKNAEHFYRDKR